MKILSILTGILILTAMKTLAQSNFYDFIVKDIDGRDFSFTSLKGKKVMIVNVASECGLTPQYAQLQQLYEKYKDRGFIIIGFPANNFGQQEPGSNQQIKNFCTSHYGVTFPMMSKISVKGKDIHPLYQWLTQKKLNGNIDSEVKWNFQKYLINEKGQLDKVIDPQVTPTDPVITEWIENK